MRRAQTRPVAPIFPSPPPPLTVPRPSPFFPPILQREKLKARFGNVETHIGGKGTTRRPVKTSHKASAVDEKKLQAGLKKLAVNAVPSIETVQLFKNDGSVLQFNSPKGAFAWSWWDAVAGARARGGRRGGRGGKGRAAPRSARARPATA